MSNDPRSVVRLSDGRALSYLDLGDPAGLPVLFTIGSPSSAVGGKAFAPSAARNGLRLISIDKPGYGDSTRDPYRPLLRFGDDVRQLADALGLDRVAVAGQSGGGPHAIAAAHVLGDRTSTLALISSAGPLTEPWARDGLKNPLVRVTTWCANHAPALMPVTLGVLRLSMGNPARAAKLIARAEKKMSETERAEHADQGTADILAGLSEGFRDGVAAACDEFRVLGLPWGFDVADVRVQTDVWHGTHDTSCPIEMARAMAARLPNATLHELDGLGHNFYGAHLDEAMATLRERASAAVA